MPRSSKKKWKLETVRSNVEVIERAVDRSNSDPVSALDGPLGKGNRPLNRCVEWHALRQKAGYRRGKCAARAMQMRRVDSGMPERKGFIVYSQQIVAVIGISAMSAFE